MWGLVGCKRKKKYCKKRNIIITPITCKNQNLELSSVVLPVAEVVIGGQLDRLLRSDEDYVH